VKQTLQQIETWLRDAKERRLWGQLTIDIKDGSAYLMRSTVQTKLDEDQTRADSRSR